MNFLQPQFFYGLFALSIPVIVHLFNFRRVKKVYFTNTVFLEQVEQSSSAKRKLKHYLILASRLIALFFLIMAFTQPFLPSSEEGLQSSHVVIYLDNSHSLSNFTQQEIKGLDEGIAYANEILALYPRETKFLLLTNDFSAFSNAFKNKEKIADYLTEVNMTSAIRTFQEVQDRITSIVYAHSIATYDTYIISDFQKSTLGEPHRNDSDTASVYHMIPILHNNTTNIYIDSVYLENPFDMEANKSKVNVTLKNTGGESIHEATLKLYLNDQQISAKAIDIPADGSASVKFDIVNQLEGESLAKFTIDDYPIAFDNGFYFNLNTKQPLKVIEIRGNTDVTAIEKVYGNKVLFDYLLMSENNINYELLKNADLVILHELSKLNPSLSNQLLKYKQSGGKIVIVPSISFQPDQYGLLIGTSANKVTTSEKQQMISLQKPDLSDPFYANIFEQNNTSFSMPAVKNILTWNTLNDLLRDNSGAPYLSYHEDHGISYLFASPFTELYTNFSQQAIFVPIMYKLASHKSSNNQPLYYMLGSQNITVRLDSMARDNIYKLVQDEQALIPEQSIVGDELLLELPKNLIHPGFAHLTLGDQTQRILAFNTNSKESIPEQLLRDELLAIATRSATLDLLETTDASHFATEMRQRFQGIHLWKYAIAISLLFLFIEILIIRYYKPSEK